MVKRSFESGVHLGEHLSLFQRSGVGVDSFVGCRTELNGRYTYVVESSTRTSEGTGSIVTYLVFIWKGRSETSLHGYVLVLFTTNNKILWQYTNPRYIVIYWSRSSNGYTRWRRISNLLNGCQCVDHSHLDLKFCSRRTMYFSSVLLLSLSKWI